MTKKMKVNLAHFQYHVCAPIDRGTYAVNLEAKHLISQELLC